MKNSLTDLNNHLFAQLERLNDEGLDATEIATEVDRAKAVAVVAKVISDNAKLELDAKRLALNVDSFAGQKVTLLGREVGG